MSTVVVTTQTELDEAISRRDPGLSIIIDSPGDVRLDLRETPSRTVARGCSRVITRGIAGLAAYDRAHITACDQSHVSACGRVFVKAWDWTHVDAWGDQVCVDVRGERVTVVRRP